EWNWNRGAIVNYYSINDYSATNAGRYNSGPDNNGNVRRQQHWSPNNDQMSSYQWFTQDYSYDALNRLASVSEQMNETGTVTQQHYIYDRYGNRTINTALTSATLTPKAFAVNAGTNQLIPATGPGVMSYDAAGNLTFDTHSTPNGAAGGGTRTYDANHRMTAAQAGSLWHYYTYDAAGKRSRRTVNGQTTWQVSGFDGELLAEYPAGAAPIAPQKEYGYRGGELLVTAEGTFTTDLFADSIWVQDALPVGAAAGGGSEPWTWVTANPVPASGSQSVQSQVAAGTHQMYFEGATTTLAVNAGDKLVAYVYLDPANTPSEIMIQWHDNSGGGWEHRAYWGANQIGWGVEGTNSRRYMGPLPAANQWVRLEVPASAVGLVNKTVTGLALSLYSGRATWDRAGKAAAGQTSWLVSDHLGTPRMVIDQTGNLAGIKRHDYLPFGEEVGAGVGGRTTGQGYSQQDGVRQKFTGYERDDETGLDYAEARYYASAQGRFTSVDPSNVSMVPMNPQSWNRYAYVLNNPLAYVDENGKWPTSTHNRLIELAFPGLSKKEIKQIQQGSRSVDIKGGVIPITLLPSEAHKHAMRQEGETVEQAVEKSVGYVLEKSIEARKQQAEHEQDGGTGLSNDALETFGQATHPLTDNTSPAHTGFQVYTLHVDDADTPTEAAGAAVQDVKGLQEHKKIESRPPTAAERRQAVQAMQTTFRNVFGDEAYKRAIKQPRPARRREEE
ncbi:MAG: RHS repeat-associated core domain-containing protein, partial [Pyrinomonadaceae bacterium]